MNNRIQELANQAGIVFKDNGSLTQGHTIEDIKKFAELIIKECIDITQVGSITETKLKKHFGVKE